MPYQVSWIIPYRVLYITETGDLTIEDIRGSTRLVADHLEEAYQNASGKVIIGLVDMRGARLGVLLRSLLSIAMKRIIDSIDPRIWQAKPGFVVLITTSDSAAMLLSLIMRIFTQPMTTVATLDEALAVLKNMYPELGDQLDAAAQSKNMT